MKKSLCLLFLLYFLTSIHAKDSVEAMIITPEGNVGIGTSNPTEKLEINGSIIASGNLVVNSVIENDKSSEIGYVVKSTDWNIPIEGGGFYSAGNYNMDNETIVSDTRLFATGTDFDIASGVFTAPKSGFYIFSFRPSVSGYSGRLLISCSLNEGSPVEIIDVDPSVTNVGYPDLMFSNIIYLKEGDTHRVLKHVGSTYVLNTALISYLYLY